MKMYSEWASLFPIISENINNAQTQSVLGKFSTVGGRDVAAVVIKQLANTLGITNNAEPSNLYTDQEVQWCMDVICHGLSLPLSEHDIIKDGVNIYCEWISAVLPQTKVSVPKPIKDDPNTYVRRIIKHLYNLFVPRPGEGTDTINRQAVLCHRVLRTLQDTAQNSQILTVETWETLLLFLLAINEILLAPPIVKDDVGDQLCERVLSVLFEVWLLACSRCFPSPSLWKTFQESCAAWRHRMALVEQWNRVNLVLTAKLLEFTYGPAFPEMKIAEEDAHLVPAGMTNDGIAQAWIRFLKILGAPTDLCSPQVISCTPQFIQAVLVNVDGIDPQHHPCLLNLPQIFLKTMKGIAGLVDAFLGFTKGSFSGLTSSRSSTGNPSAAAPSSSLQSTGFSSMLSLCQENRYPLATNRPRCNSILHLFGEWLFDAAHIGGETWMQNTKKRAAEAKRRPSSMIMDNRKGSLSQPPSLSEVNDVAPGLTIDKYESGKAEALGALCRIFCAKKTGEEILPVYLARFYMALHQGLKTNDNRECMETLASILYNSSDLFRIDLEGIQVLLPSFIGALELILPEKELKMRSHNVLINKIELRRAAINILLSLLALPLHFQALPIRDLMGGPNDRSITFIHLKPRLINVLMNALQVETDPQNTHMLLGGLHLCVQDSVTFEEMENGPEALHVMHPTADTSNLLSSACSEKSAYSMNSANSSIGGLSTATLSNEPSSLPAFDDFTSDIIHELELSSSAIYDSAHALFVRATYLVCHRLISSWKTDLNVSLAALELLSGLAAMRVKDSGRCITRSKSKTLITYPVVYCFADALECKRAVKWICDYICYQCSRPPPAHVKDLHSTIVAAFQCTSAWLMNHPYLLQDKECLTIVLEVVELGISGSKSIGKPGEPVKYKGEKELKPASMRVRDAAENMLTMILEQIDYFPNECGKQSLSSLLDEVVLAKHSNTSGENVGELPQEQAIKKFKYFVTENSTVLALFEEPLGNDQDPQPTVTILIRGPFGRHAWTMQLRHLSRSKSGTKYHAPNPGRPVPMNDIMMRQEVEYKYFPDSVERIPPCIVDYSIPTLDSAEQKMGNQSTKELGRLLEDQLVYEKLSWAETECSVDGLGHAQEASPPSVCHEFQAARLFLSHFGFLTIGQNNVGGPKMDGSAPLLTTLDTSKAEFCQDLKMLDKMSPRSCDTIHVFYVRAGQTTEAEIIGNMDPENLASIDRHFWKILYTIGSPVTVQEHAGWTGFIGSSWKIPRDASASRSNEPSNASRSNVAPEEWQLNGEKKVLYWADISSEMAIVVPSRNNKIDVCLEETVDGANGGPSTTYERSVSEIQPRSSSVSSNQSRQYSLDSESTRFGSMSKSADPIPPVRRRTGASKPNTLYTAPTAKILLVWLESYEDHLTFPIDDLLHYTRAGYSAQHGPIASINGGECFIIYLHALSSSLLRVKLQGPVGRMNFAIPLIDGMVVSKRVIGSLIRQTACNMAKRKRLDNDSYQPPHVRRRIKIQEMMQKYKKDLTEPEMLADLFKPTI
ncbi:ral GTPase-activating protein subunit beta isoform X3 [Anopheles coustani]|uniref:ral GTPase-activating protein subunit beta isoform X3 n=1 Tax=Anopheles coustani TaxID=139045 RepID=UPI0026581B80|nr:ral GTPase-activating protein subunit beta isoform X3 [Anopheles coustani]